MPLIDLKTDLKNLGYGSDKPYVTKDINNPPKYNSVSKEVTARVDDVTRVTKMFASANGIKFVAHEALLNSEGTGDRIKKSRAFVRQLGEYDSNSKQGRSHYHHSVWSDCSTAESVRP